MRVFETREVREFEELVAEDVLIHGGGQHIQGRRYPEGSVLTPGCPTAASRWTASSRPATGSLWPSRSPTLTYAHDRSGRDLTMTAVKSYRLHDGRIVEFWGETDLYGLLRQAGLIPEQIPPF
ncbi:ester cyclase [Kitasatospora sp. NBC_01250]